MPQKIMILAMLVGIHLLIANQIYAQEMTNESRQRIIYSTVQIFPIDEKGQRIASSSNGSVLSGSGTIISGDGLVITNRHVVSSNSKLYSRQQIWFSASADRVPFVSVIAELIAEDAQYDLALLRITRTSNGIPIPQDKIKLPFIELGDSNRIQVGDKVLIAGFPGISGSTFTLSQGIMQGWIGENRQTDEGKNWIKTDAEINPGNSGGGAYNSQGQLIGIPTAVSINSANSSFEQKQGWVRPINMAAWLLSQANTKISLPAPRVSLTVAPINFGLSNHFGTVIVVHFRQSNGSSYSNPVSLNLFFRTPDGSPETYQSAYSNPSYSYYLPYVSFRSGIYSVSGTVDGYTFRKSIVASQGTNVQNPLEPPSSVSFELSAQTKQLAIKWTIAREIKRIVGFITDKSGKTISYFISEDNHITVDLRGSLQENDTIGITLYGQDNLLVNAALDLSNLVYGRASGFIYEGLKVGESVQIANDGFRSAKAGISLGPIITPDQGIAGIFSYFRVEEEGKSPGSGIAFLSGPGGWVQHIGTFRGNESFWSILPNLQYRPGNYVLSGIYRGKPFEATLFAKENALVDSKVLGTITPRQIRITLDNQKQFSANIGLVRSSVFVVGRLQQTYPSEARILDFTFNTMGTQDSPFALNFAQINLSGRLFMDFYFVDIDLRTLSLDQFPNRISVLRVRLGPLATNTTFQFP